MKSTFALIFLALILGIAYAKPTAFDDVESDCNVNGIGIPDCSTKDASGTRYRNNWDPTRYFVCENGEAVVVECEISGFDPVKDECVPWSQWIWYPPCTDYAALRQ